MLNCLFCPFGSFLTEESHDVKQAKGEVRVKVAHLTSLHSKGSVRLYTEKCESTLRFVDCSAVQLCGDNFHFQSAERVSLLVIQAREVHFKELNNCHVHLLKTNDFDHGPIVHVKNVTRSYISGNGCVNAQNLNSSFFSRSVSLMSADPLSEKTSLLYSMIIPDNLLSETRLPSSCFGHAVDSYIELRKGCSNFILDNSVVVVRSTSSMSRASNSWIFLGPDSILTVSEQLNNCHIFLSKSSVVNLNGKCSCCHFSGDGKIILEKKNIENSTASQDIECDHLDKVSIRYWTP